MHIPKANPLFNAWSGAPVDNNYGGKVLLILKNQPAFAELVILQLFQEEGWQGVWVDTFGGKYRTEYWPKNEVVLPAEQQKLLQAVSGLAGSQKGCWDVFCWQDDLIIFAESKRRAHDAIRDTQRRWLQGALQYGLPITSFLIVEWSLGKAVDQV